MASELLLGVRLTPVEKMTVIKLNAINLKEKVEKLRIETSVKTNLANDSFDLIYCGCLLENESVLESYGLKNGSMVHVLKKRENKETADANMTTSDSEPNVDMLTSVFKSFIGNPLLELAMRRLTKRPEVIENIISSSPGLSEDAVAIAILQDPDLIVHFTNADTIKKIAKLHPALLEAAQHIASAVHDEAHNFAASSASMNSSTMSNAHASGHSYSLENFSDDEEMAGDSSQSSDSTQPSNSARSPSSSAITSAQLLAAISRARSSRSRTSGGAGSSGSARNNSSPSAAARNFNAGGAITFEMFNQAMQQAFASNSGQATSASSSTPTATPAAFVAPQSTAASSDSDIQSQMTIMHEMGLRNDAINVQALQITNGDVQAAIELVLSGFGDN